MMGTMTHPDEAPESIVVVGPDGRPLAIPAGADGTPLTGQVIADDDEPAGEASEREDGGESLADMVEQPAKVMRIGTMIKQLLEEVRAAPWTTPAAAASRRSTSPRCASSNRAWPPSCATSWSA